MYDPNFYGYYFGPLDEYLQDKTPDISCFIDVLKSCEAAIGHQQSYGEMKAFILLKSISLIYNTQPFVFCSDDRGARAGFANIAQIPCISILSVFLKMKIQGKAYEDVAQFYQSFVDWCMYRENPQNKVKVWQFESGTWKRNRAPIQGVL